MRALHRLAATLLAAPVAMAMLVVLGAPTTAVEMDPVGVWPLQPKPEVVARFDPPDLPWGSGHRGVDLLGRAGQTVHASLQGRVTYAGPLAGRGVVVVSHGVTRTTYEPVTATVTVGQEVVGGEPLGTLERAGSHCLPRVCLHWGWLRGTTYLDPLDLVGDWSVRLLPLWRQQPAPPPSAPVLGSLAPAVSWSVPYAGILAQLVALTGRSPPEVSW